MFGLDLPAGDVLQVWIKSFKRGLVVFGLALG